MLHIDYGLGILATSVVHDWTTNGSFDLADLYRDLVRRSLLAGLEVHERFYEIGSPAGIRETDKFLRQQPRAGRS
jgi:MurNAc alpha-1-phosphate uridylyltransferase